MLSASALLKDNVVLAGGTQKTICEAQRVASKLKTRGDSESDRRRQQTSRLVATNHNINDVDWLQNLNEDITWIQGDPVQEISQQLNQNRQAGKTTSELHIIAHGNNGEIKLGNTFLTKQYLEKSSDLLQEWNLKAIYLWSCEAGLNTELTTTLEECTGADIYSSKEKINREQPNISSKKEKTASLEALIGQEHLQRWSSSLIFTTLVKTSSYANQAEVLSDGRYVYVADDSGGLKIVDLQAESGPAIVGTNYRPFGVDMVFDVIANSTHAFLSYNNSIFLSGSDASQVHVLDISDPTSPTVTDTITLPIPGGATGVSAWHLTLNGNDLYVSDNTAGIHIVDVSDPSNLSLTTTFGSTSVNHYDAAVSGNYVFAATDSGLIVYDASAAYSVVGNASLSGSGSGRNIELSADAQTAFLANQNGGLDIFDVSNPAAPILLDSYSTSGVGYEVILSSDESQAYLADGLNGLVILDVSDTSNIQLVDTHATSGRASGVQLSSDEQTIFAVSTQTTGDPGSHGLELGVFDEIDPLITGPSGSPGDTTSSKSIAENTTAISQFTANETVSWSLNGGDDADKFSIDSDGNLVFNSAPDFEDPNDIGDTANNNTYVVIVRATDNAGNTADQTVTITVTDVDEIDPLITGPSGSAGDTTSSKSIAENTTAISQFTANETVSWSLNGGDDADKFSIDSDGNLVFNSAPDFEDPNDIGDTANNNTYVVIVRATDNAGNTADQTVTITVTDVDEIDPLITGPSGSAGDTTSSKSIAENTTAISQFTANETVSWSLNGGDDADKFSIDSDGNLVFNSAPDFEDPNDIGDTANNNTYVVIVRATDNAGNTADQTVTITVTDVDEIDPLITGPSGSAGDTTSSKSIAENTTAISQFTANETVSWSLNGGDDADKFSIDSDGNLVFNSAPDFEDPNDIGDTANNNTYVVIVRATDNAGNTADQTVTITVTDVDEIDPLITGPSGSPGDTTSSKSIAENTTAISQFTANETVSWSLNGGDDADKFSIDSDGNLVFNSAPDFEDPNDIGDTANNNTYVVIVRATDNAGNTADQTVTITVTDVDEIDPLITGPSGSAGDTTSSKSIAENTTAISQFTANETVSWSLNGGDDADKFSIDSDGNLVFNSAPDFEDPNDIGDTANNNTYVVIVRATDNAGNTADQTVTITVTDVDDNGITIAQTGSSDDSGNLLTTEAGGSSNFSVVLDNEPTANVTVSITGNDATEGTLSNSLLTFTTTNWNTAQTVTITGVDDDIDDGDITTTLIATANNAGGYSGNETSSIFVENADDDTNGISITQTGTTDGSGILLTTEAGGSSSFTVVLNAEPTSDVTVTITGNDATENSLSANSLTFTSTNWNVAQTIRIKGIDDNIDDGDITTTLTATASNTGNYTGTETRTITVKNTASPNPALTNPPNLIATADGNSLKILGTESSGTWVRLETDYTDAALQNSLQIISSTRGQIGTIGAISSGNILGKTEIYLEEGEILSFALQSSNNSPVNTPNIQLVEQDKSWQLALEDSDSNPDNDFNDLIITISTHDECQSPMDYSIAQQQNQITDGLFNLRDTNSDSINLQISVTSSSDFNNRLAFVRLDDDSSDLSLNGISAFNEAAFKDAITGVLIDPASQRIELQGESSQTITWNLDEDEFGLYAAVLITEENEIITIGSSAFQNESPLIKSIGQNHFGFEDNPNSSDVDFDYNDLTFEITVL